MANEQVPGVLEAAVSGLLMIWFDYAWIAVPLMTLLLAAAVGSLIFGCEKRIKRCKERLMEPSAMLGVWKRRTSLKRRPSEFDASSVTAGRQEHLTHQQTSFTADGDPNPDRPQIAKEAAARQLTEASNNCDQEPDNNNVLQLNQQGSTALDSTSTRTDPSTSGRKHRSKPDSIPSDVGGTQWRQKLLRRLASLEFTNWRSVGLQLKLSLAKLNNIQLKNQHDPDFQQQCKIDVFAEWLKEDISVNSYLEGIQKVSDALNKSGEMALAAQMIPEYDHHSTRHSSSSPCSTPSTTQPPSLVEPSLPRLYPSPHEQCLVQYARYLKSLYCSRPFPTYFKFPIIRQRAKHFINLALVDSSAEPEEQQASVLLQINGQVDEIRKKKKSLRIDEVGRLKDGSTAYYILIEGAPGIGKTTFAWELCRQWAKELLLQQWSVFILIQMRDKRVRLATTLKDLLYHPEPYVSESVSQLLYDTDGKGVLLLFEGYDEISDSQQSEDSVFQQILRKELLSQAAIIVSSRPIASQTLCEHFRGQIQQHIEILGFSRDNIEAYVASACSENQPLKDDFDQYLSCHPFTYSVMYVPLYCSIITELYYTHWSTGKKEFAPKTLTEIYTALIFHLLQRHFEGNPAHSLQHAQLQNLPEDIYWRLVDVGRLAVDGIQKHQYIFDSLGFDHMGLMQVIQDLYIREKPLMSFSFLHQTLQEFLAAFHLTQRPHREILQVLQQSDLFPIQNYLQGEHRKESNTMFHWPVLLFIAGLTKLQNVPLNMLQLFSKDEDDSGVKFHPAIFQLLFETQSQTLISSIFTKKLFRPHPWEMTLLDWFMAGYCIANSSPSANWAIEYEHDHVQTVQGLEMLVRGINYQVLPGKRGGKVHSISLLGGDKLLQCVKTILDIHEYAHTLSELILGGDLGPGRKTNLAIKQIPTFFPLLTRLQVSSLQSFANWEALLRGLSQLQLLQRLELEANITEKDASLLCEQIPQCLSLKCLMLWFNEDSDGASSLVVGVSPLAAGRLESLDLQRCTLNSGTTNALAESLGSPQCSLGFLRLRETNMSVDNFSILATSIAKNTSLKTLSLNDCGIDDTAVVCLATALTQNKSLEKVELMEWYMSEDTELLLKEAVKQNSNIKNLELAPRNLELPKEILELYGLYQ